MTTMENDFVHPGIDEFEDSLTDTNPFEDLSYAEIQAQLSLPFESAFEDDEVTNFSRVLDFHAKYGHPIGVWPASPSELKHRLKLIEEEFVEVSNEFHTPYAEVDKQKLAKELADLLYVVYGTAASFGISIDHVFKEVHKSNMSKGTEKNADGKTLKGPNYQPPDLSFV